MNEADIEFIIEECSKGLTVIVTAAQKQTIQTENQMLYLDIGAEGTVKEAKKYPADGMYNDAYTVDVAWTDTAIMHYCADDRYAIPEINYKQSVPPPDPKQTALAL
ncbi:hypothetical protein C4573_05230 [Candidatus Woesearchaeota archaeon]|nr:MAG: hypothetical protein C4573_05230 [Candidatus Woesearchaeota archaeon]